MVLELGLQTVDYYRAFLETRSSFLSCVLRLRLFLLGTRPAPPRRGLPQPAPLGRALELRTTVAEAAAALRNSRRAFGRASSAVTLTHYYEGAIIMRTKHGKLKTAECK